MKLLSICSLLTAHQAGFLSASIPWGIMYVRGEEGMLASRSYCARESLAFSSMPFACAPPEAFSPMKAENAIAFLFFVLFLIN